MKHQLALLMLGLLSPMVLIAADSSSPAPATDMVGATTATPLEEAVRQFNAMTASQKIGKDEPPLTVDEVVAAIRGWIPSEIPVQPEILKIYQEIAESRILPPGAELRATIRWIGYNDYHFDVWWVDLRVGPVQRAQRDPVLGYGYVFRIRDRKIHSRPMTEADEVRIWK